MPARGGFTLIEMAVSLVLLSVIGGMFFLTTDSASNATRTGVAVAELDATALRALDRVCDSLKSSSADLVTPKSVAPFSGTQIDFKRGLGADASGKVVWGPLERFSLVYDEANNGVDDDGDGLVDEGRLVWTENPGLAGERSTVLCEGVREYLAGETFDGTDENKNGLIDERGCARLRREPRDRAPDAGGARRRGPSPQHHGGAQRGLPQPGQLRSIEMQSRPTDGSVRRGSTLITVTILLGTMTVMALVLLRVGQRLGQEQDENVEATRASLLAEAGISEAVQALRSGQSGGLGTAELPAYLGGGVVWVEATDLGGGKVQLDSMAMKDSGRSALRVVVEGTGGAGAEGKVDAPNDGFTGMLFSNKQMVLNQSITVDSYDSTLGTYASQATNTYGGTTYAGAAAAAASNAGVTLSDKVKVFGDVHCGPSIVPTLQGSAYVSGNKTPNSKTIPLAAIPVPAVAASGAYAVANSATKTLASGTYHFTSLTQGKFST
jgi:prepilin-type N-terminal cleavage/methylation domain-containing protein